MLRSHDWLRDQNHWMCVKCFNYTMNPTVNRKGCKPSLNISDTLKRLAAQVEFSNQQMRKLMRNLNGP